jgi:hypothetical protein
MMAEAAVNDDKIDLLYESVTRRVEDRIKSYSDAATEGQVSLRVLRPLGFYVRDHFGRETLDVICEDDIDAVALLQGIGWVDAGVFDEFLSKIYELVGCDDAKFDEAAVYRLADAYGPLRYLLWATTTKSIYLRSMRTHEAVSTTIEECHIVGEGKNWIRASLTTVVPETKLMLALRMAQLAALPTLWGLPRAELKVEIEGECTYKYTVRWKEEKNYLPLLVGTFAGALSSITMCSITGHMFPWIIFTAMGALLGYVVMIKRIYSVAIEYQMQRANSALKSEIDLLPIIGILRRMGSISDNDLDVVFAKGITSGEHLLDLLVRQHSVTEEDVAKARELYEKIKKGNSKAIDAMFEAVDHNAERRRGHLSRMTAITNQASIKIGEG